jgi:hemolysin III
VNLSAGGTLDPLTLDSRRDLFEGVAIPRFRGVAHLIALVVAAPAGVLLVVHAKAGIAQLGAFVFSVSVVAMLGVSSLFHRRQWTPSRKKWIGILDHAMIYLLIGGTYTPIALLVLNAGWRVPILTAVWGGGILATAAKLMRPDAPAWVAAATCLVLGWISVVVLPQIVERIGLGPASLLILGGAAYTAGAVVYARRRPDPLPHAFGYHEIFHALVVVAIACQYLTIGLFVLPRA